jgi:hypothetical protein
MVKFYYTVEKEVEDENLTGNKTITVYSIVDNEPVKLTDIESVIEDNSKEKIVDYFDENGFGDAEYELILL